MSHNKKSCSCKACPPNTLLNIHVVREHLRFNGIREEPANVPAPVVAPPAMDDNFIAPTTQPNDAEVVDLTPPPPDQPPPPLRPVGSSAFTSRIQWLAALELLGGVMDPLDVNKSTPLDALLDQARIHLVHATQQEAVTAAVSPVGLLLPLLPVLCNGAVLTLIDVPVSATSATTGDIRLVSLNVRPALVFRWRAVRPLPLHRCCVLTHRLCTFRTRSPPACFKSTAPR